MIYVHGNIYLYLLNTYPNKKTLAANALAANALAAQCTSLFWILSSPEIVPYGVHSWRLLSSCLRTNKVGKASSHPWGFITWWLTAFISSQISLQFFLTSRQLITSAFSSCYSHKKWKGILIHSWATCSLAYTHAGPPTPQKPKIGRAWSQG